MTDGAVRRSARLIRNLIAWAVLMALLVSVHFIIAADPMVLRSAAQAAVFGWPWLAIVGVAGTLGAIFTSLTPLRGLWDADISVRAKLLWPALLGIVLGAAVVIGDRSTGWSHIVAAKMHLPSIHIAFPYSVPIYFGGAILVTVIYYFALIPFLNWLVSGRILKGRGEAIVYWVCAIPLAFVEPLTQNDFSDIARSGWIAVPNAAGDLLLNFSQVWFLRRSGLIAAITVRVGFYAVWHVLYGLLTRA